MKLIQKARTLDLQYLSPQVSFRLLGYFQWKCKFRNNG
jgi:hypothetical protein